MHITLLEPRMVAAVDLDQLADTCAAVAGLVDLGCALPAGRPQPRGRHQRSHRLDTDCQTMAFGKLLAGQRGPEVRVALPDQPDRALRDPRRQLVVAGSASLARNQPDSAFVPVSLDQALKLPSTQAQPLRGLDGLDAVGFAHRHGDSCRRCCHRFASGPEAGPGQPCDISIRAKRDITIWGLHCWAIQSLLC